MSGYTTAPWSDFSVATVGATAALTGLLFVAVSINIEQISAAGALTGRAASTMVHFVVPLLVGVLLLVPDQSRLLLGPELVVLGVAAGAALLRVNRPSNRSAREPRSSWLLVRLAPTVVMASCLVLAGTTLAAGAGGGLYWIAPAVLVALVGGLATVWVLLVEIRR
jgi:hypothetical protein